MVKFLHFKTMALLLLMIVGASSAWAETVTFAYGDYKGKGTSSSGSEYTMVKTDVSIGDTKFYGNNNYAHFYASGVTTITPASGVTITKIELTASATGYNGYQSSGTITASIGSVSGSTSSTTVTWTGSATEAFTISHNKQIRWTSIVVTYSKEAAVKTDPTITFNSGSVRVGKTLDLSTLFNSNSTGAVTYSITSGDSYATLSNSVLTATAEGSVTVKAEQAATGTYNAGEATATITVNAALTLSSIAITTAPTKTTYNEGETFDATGMVVTATYSDNSTDDVTTSCTFSPDGALTTSDTEITVSYTENNVTKTTTQAITVNEVVDYATLPFNWEGGSSSALNALTGVTTSGLGSDYASGNAPYLVKFDNTGDYIQVKTGSQPGVVTIHVKMIGGSSASSITVQESTDGVTFNNVETLAISGSQNSILELETSNAFESTTLYVRLYFDKGSNVGVGPISITKATTDPVINAGVAKYVKVTDASTLRAGDQFILVYETGSLALGAINSGGKYYESASVTISDNTVTNPSGVAVLTLGGEEGAWTINSSLSGDYLSLTGNSNELKAATSVSEDNTENWTISIGDYVKIINNANPQDKNGNDRYIQWNKSSGSERFACYGGTQQNLQLYRLSKSVTITSAGYATYCSDAAMNFDGVVIKAYTATDNGSSVRLTEITSGQVPANTPVVLYKDGGTTANVPVIASADAVGSNDLRVSTGENPTNAYVLANVNGTVGFYLWDSSVTLNAGKVYLQANSSTGNARQFLPFGETTAIENVNVSKTLNGEVYDLQGRRVVKPQKGLYIVNGRKVVVK